MKKQLMFNGGEVMRIENNKYYILDETWWTLKECNRNEFIKELNRHAYACLTSWDKQLKQDYLDLVQYCEEIRKKEVNK